MQLYEASSHPAPYSRIPSTDEIPRSLFPECALISFVSNCNIMKALIFIAQIKLHKEILLIKKELYII